jgi:hypothetical protein
MLEHVLGVEHRNAVFEPVAHPAGARALDGDRPAALAAADPHAARRRPRQIALPAPFGAEHGGAPGVAVDEKPAFDLDGHGRPASSGLFAACDAGRGRALGWNQEIARRGC